MISFTIEARLGKERISLAFESDNGRLVATGDGKDIPDVVVQSFDPARDIFYRTPGKLSTKELAEEVAIHIPQSVRQSFNKRIVPATLDGLVLMQYAEGDAPVISPLAALAEILRASGSVNSGILHADRSGLLFVHRSGTELLAYASAYSLKTLLALDKDERNKIFPNIHAAEILLSGPALDHFRDLDFGPLMQARRIAMTDYTGISKFTMESLERVGMAPHRYTLAIGAAAAYAQILAAA